MTPITKSEWMDWKSNKVTYEYLSRLHGMREEYKEGLVEGRAEGKEQQDVVIGRCQGLKDAVDYAVKGFDVIDPTAEEESNA